MAAFSLRSLAGSLIPDLISVSSVDLTSKHAKLHLDDRTRVGVGGGGGGGVRLWSESCKVYVKNFGTVILHRIDLFVERAAYGDNRQRDVKV